MKKLNNKGYLLVEIIVASVLAMGIAYFLMNLTIRFSREDEDIYRSISWTNDKNILTNKIMRDVYEYGLVSVNVDSNTSIVFTFGDDSSKELVIDEANRNITYGDYESKIDSSFQLGDVSVVNDEDYLSVRIPMKSIYSSLDYGIYLFIPYSVESFINTKLSTYLLSLYHDGTKKSVTTAGGESIDQVSDLGLMQDSFGNIRYYGSDPNNYVSFNDELWRIIGVFEVEDENGNIEQRVKIIRDESIGQLAYDTQANGRFAPSQGINDWSNSRLMMVLNPGYEASGGLYVYEGSLYWNGKSGSCYTSSGSSESIYSCDFTSTGLTDEVKDMIGQSKYYLGSISSSVYSDDYYTFERGTTVYSGHATEWTGYIGLMYPSDYTYAADLSLCTETGEHYDDIHCTGTNWLYLGVSEWTISPGGSIDNAFAIHSNGDIHYFHYDDWYVLDRIEVRPVFYLKNVVMVSGGDGTQENPYTLSL